MSIPGLPMGTTHTHISIHCMCIIMDMVVFPIMVTGDHEHSNSTQQWIYLVIMVIKKPHAEFYYSNFANSVQYLQLATIPQFSKGSGSVVTAY